MPRMQEALAFIFNKMTKKMKGRKEQNWTSSQTVKRAGHRVSSSSAHYHEAGVDPGVGVLLSRSRA